MSRIEDDNYAMNYLHQEMLCTLLRRFEEVPKRQRLQAIRYTINIHLERSEKENKQPRVVAFKSLKLLIDKVKSVRELERLVAEKSEVEKAQK
jgi:hypothetical protein